MIYYLLTLQAPIDNICFPIQDLIEEILFVFKKTSLASKKKYYFSSVVNCLDLIPVEAIICGVFTKIHRKCSTAVRLHVYLVFVKSIEQELKIQ